MMPLRSRGKKSQNRRDSIMREEKSYIVMDNYEQNIIINALNEMRNRLKSEERPTDAVDELILKTANAKKKGFRVSERGEYEAR